MLAMRIILLALAAHLGAGVVFGAVFLARGIGRVDPAARGSPWGFRLLMLPGVAVLWPVVAVKWRRAARGGTGGRA